jgi:hypothetical protein
MNGLKKLGKVGGNKELRDFTGSFCWEDRKTAALRYKKLAFYVDFFTS